MKKLPVSRFRHYKKSGAMLYVPEAICRDPEFPFADGEIVKIRIEKDRIVQEKAEWWELVDWSKVPEAYAKLPEEIREKIGSQRPRSR